MDAAASHYLYVIAAQDALRGPVKLGISADPEARLRDLQTASPLLLVIHHREPVEARFVKQMEKLLHRDMAHRRQRGEWFNIAVAEAISHVRFTIMRYENELIAAAAWRD